jgi:hypothetical protein
MLRNASVELVDREVALAGQQLKALRRDDQMHEALLGAHGAVAGDTEDRSAVTLNLTRQLPS